MTEEEKLTAYHEGGHAMLITANQRARPCRTAIDNAARRRGHRISAGYGSYWH
jgi:hypothetical protein